MILSNMVRYCLSKNKEIIKTSEVIIMSRNRPKTVEYLENKLIKIISKMSTKLMQSNNDVNIIIGPENISTHVKSAEELSDVIYPLYQSILYEYLEKFPKNNSSNPNKFPIVLVSQKYSYQDLYNLKNWKNFWKAILLRVQINIDKTEKVKKMNFIKITHLISNTKQDTSLQIIKSKMSKTIIQIRLGYTQLFLMINYYANIVKNAYKDQISSNIDLEPLSTVQDD